MFVSASRRASIALLTAAVCTLGACHRQPATPPNVLIVLIDTLRADRLGAYGSTRGLTPFLDELAARSTVFPTAYSQSSWTNPSVASLLTSRYQSQHRVTSFESALSLDETTLPEVLKTRGYATGGFSANILVRGGLGFGQGFDRYEMYHREGRDPEDYLKARADRINAEALQWLDGVRAGPTPPPVLLYLHYMEPHNPYDPPEPVLERVLAGRPRPDIAEANRWMRIAYLMDFTAEEVADVEALYDAEIASLDAQLRVLFTGLEQRGFLHNAIVVVTADHGEELNEHELMGHHKSLFEPAIRIPLLVHVPGQTTGAHGDGLAELVDIAPTLLELLEVPQPGSFVGQPLLTRAVPGGWFGGARPSAPSTQPRTEAFSELIKEPGAPRVLPHERAIIAESSKLLVSPGGDRFFFDLAADPGETDPQGVDATRRARLETAFGDLRAFAAQPADGARHVVGMDEQTKERMRALGYAE